MCLERAAFGVGVAPWFEVRVKVINSGQAVGSV